MLQFGGLRVLHLLLHSTASLEECVQLQENHILRFQTEASSPTKFNVFKCTVKSFTDATSLFSLVT